MANDIFISYSRRDQEFVTRFASDLNEQVAFVWLDRSTIQPGQKWHDEIMEGIQECKAFILVLSPDAMESQYVREEVNKALELGKPIFPILYRTANWTDEFAALIKNVQTLDLRSGSYTDNFHKLVDGLIETGAVRAAAYEKPFLRQPTKPGLKLVFSKAIGWAGAWSLGWLVFWVITFLFLFLFIILQNKAGREDFLNFLVFTASGWTGGLVGGSIAGLLSMLALRPYAPSISWKHMSPTIRVWAISGPVGMIISGFFTVVMLIIGIINVQTPLANCANKGVGQCLGQLLGNALGEKIATIVLILGVFIIILVVVWFLTGMFAGWLVVRHVRRLEPGITRGQGWGVSAGWGCGAIVAAIVAFLLLGFLTTRFRL
jgi:hypothetical protein